MKIRWRLLVIVPVVVVAGTLSASICHGQSSPSASNSREIAIRVDAGDRDRAVGTPLVFELPFDVESSRPATLTTVSAAKGAGFHVQIVPGTPGRAVWLLGPAMKAGEQRDYLLRNGTSAKRQVVGPLLRDAEDSIEVSYGKSSNGLARSVLGYVKTPTTDAAENEPVYSRTGYLHPLFSPAGKMITGDYAADHPHQHALFFAWTNCTFEGRDINFWDQKSGKARIRFLPNEKSEVTKGPAFTEFTVSHRHEDLSAPDGKPKPVLDETWRVRTWRPVGNYYLIDIVSTQNCASESPLTINKYHYGGMAIRGTSDWFNNEKDAQQPGDFLTSEGKTRADGNHSRPKWVDMHGPYPDGSHAGVAIFCHPDNFRFPQFVRLHPSKPYFSFTPQVEDGFEIKPGEPYVSRYRYIVHDGKPDPKLLDRMWNDYANPPKVSVIEEKK